MKNQTTEKIKTIQTRIYFNKETEASLLEMMSKVNNLGNVYIDIKLEKLKERNDAISSVLKKRRKILNTLSQIDTSSDDNDEQDIRQKLIQKLKELTGEEYEQVYAKKRKSKSKFKSKSKSKSYTKDKSKIDQIRDNFTSQCNYRNTDKGFIYKEFQKVIKSGIYKGKVIDNSGISVNVVNSYMDKLDVGFKLGDSKNEQDISKINSLQASLKDEKDPNERKKIKKRIRKLQDKIKNYKNYPFAKSNNYPALHFPMDGRKNGVTFFPDYDIVEINGVSTYVHNGKFTVKLSGGENKDFAISGIKLGKNADYRLTNITNGVEEIPIQFTKLTNVQKPVKFNSIVYKDSNKVVPIDIRSIEINKDSTLPDEWYINISVRYFDTQSYIPGTNIGLDLGLTTLLSGYDSDGCEYQYPENSSNPNKDRAYDYLERDVKYTEDLVKYNQSLSRKRTVAKKEERDPRQSNTYNKEKLNLTKLYKKRTRQLEHAINNIINDILSKYYEYIFIEDIDLEFMMTKLDFDVETDDPNDPIYKRKKNIRRKSSKSRLGGTLSTLKSKARPGSVFVVNSKYTSLTCSKCNFRDPNSRDKYVAKLFHCTNCGFVDDADLNASRNIRVRGVLKISKIKELVQNIIDVLYEKDFEKEYIEKYNELINQYSGVDPNTGELKKKIKALKYGIKKKIGDVIFNTMVEYNKSFDEYESNESKIYKEELMIFFNEVYNMDYLN